MSTTKRIEIPISDTVKGVFGDNIIVKNCDEDEQLCPFCHGLGFYGYGKDVFHLVAKLPGTSTIAYDYPYSKEYIHICPYCQGGVVKTCEYCGEPIVKITGSSCLCQDSVAARERCRADADIEKMLKRLVNADEMTIDDITKDNVVLYDEDADMYFYEIHDIVDYYESERSGEYPAVLWACTKSMIHFDAASLVEDACGYLHEDALDTIELDDINHLQDILDMWCKDQIGTITYSISYDKYIRVTDKLVQKLKIQL